MRRVAAFTLIELLVVIAIIALLMAILLPSLQRARESEGEDIDPYGFCGKTASDAAP